MTCWRFAHFFPVPMGLADGLPAGMSFIVTAFSDADLLALGHAYASLPRWPAAALTLISRPVTCRIARPRVTDCRWCALQRDGRSDSQSAAAYFSRRIPHWARLGQNRTRNRTRTRTHRRARAALPRWQRANAALRGRPSNARRRRSRQAVDRSAARTAGGRAQQVSAPMSRRSLASRPSPPWTARSVARRKWSRSRDACASIASRRAWSTRRPARLGLRSTRRIRRARGRYSSSTEPLKREHHSPWSLLQHCRSSRHFRFGRARCR